MCLEEGRFSPVYDVEAATTLAATPADFTSKVSFSIRAEGRAAVTPASLSKSSADLSRFKPIREAEAETGLPNPFARVARRCAETARY